MANFTFNPILSEIQSHMAAMSPAAQAAVKMANPALPSPEATAAVSAPSVLPHGRLLPQNPGPEPGPISMPSSQSPIAMPKPTPTLVTGPNRGQAVMSNGAQPSMLLRDQAELDRERSQGSGISQIAGKIENTRLGQAHPFLGKLLGGLAQGAATVGDVGLSIAAPEVAAMVPGTQIHHEALLNQANRALTGDVANEEKQAQSALENATAAHTQAETAALENPQEETDTEQWKPLLGGNGQVVTAPNGSVVEVSKAGELRAQPLPTGATVAPKPATPGHTAFDQWSADPAKYENFQKSMAQIKAEIAAEHPQAAKNASFMNIYAAQRFLQMAYTHNPALLPVASQMIGKLLNLTPEQTATMGEVPVDQPLSPTTGAPIGTSMPSAPTGSTRSQAQTAQRALTEIPRIRQSIDKLGNELGPVLGRWNEFETGKVGAGDPRYEELRTDLTFLNSAAAKFHLNSVRAVQEFQHLAQTGKMTPQVLNGYLNAVENWAQTAANQEKGHGETQPTNTEAPKPDFIFVPGKGLVKQ